jgi:UDP-glucose 4-epimerase
VLNNIPPIIYGDGQQTRDYTYIDDAIRAYDLVLNHNEPVAEPINFGSGGEVSITDLANLIIEFCGKKGSIKPAYMEPRIGEVKRLIANVTKAQKLLGWESKYNFEKGLKEFVQWYRNYGLEESLKLE